MIGTKLYKDNLDYKEYTDIADWCNLNNAKIIERDEYYEVVDNSPADEEMQKLQKLQLQCDLKAVTYELSQLNGTAMCGYSMDNDIQYDVIVNDELTVMNEEQFNNYYDELTEKRNDIVKQLKGL